MNEIEEKKKLCSSLYYDYTNQAVIERYCKDNNKPIDFGTEVFAQLLKWLHIAHKLQSQNTAIYMTPEINEIDNIWHSFLLFTKDYEMFCFTYFKQFIHHFPVSLDTAQPNQKEQSMIFRRYLTLIKEEFGSQTLIDWFKEKKICLAFHIRYRR